MRFLYCLMLIALGGCSLAPSYRTPEMKLPKANAHDDSVYAAFLQEKWWYVFDDTTLNKLQEIALKNNVDMKRALLAIKEGMAQLSIANSQLLPDVNGSISDSDRFVSKGSASLYGGKRYLHSVGTNFIASYELDLFAKNANATDAQRNILLATKMARESVYLSLTASVAKAYYSVVSLEEQLAVANKTLASREESYKIFVSRLKNGYCTELELNRVDAELQSAKIAAMQLEKSLSTAKMALAMLIGEDPAGIIKSLDYRFCKQLDIVEMSSPKNIVSDLLLRRPDIAQAEYELKAYNAKIGEARAAFFPKISLTSNLGYESSAFRGLMNESNNTWGVNSSISLPIFNGGRIIAANRIAKLQYQKAVLNYKTTVKQAFIDVQNAIISNTKNKCIYIANEKSVSALTRSYSLAKKKYDIGAIGLLDLLDIERGLLSAQLSFVVSKQNLINSVIDICKSIGGGWHK